MRAPQTPKKHAMGGRAFAQICQCYLARASGERITTATQPAVGGMRRSQFSGGSSEGPLSGGEVEVPISELDQRHADNEQHRLVATPVLDGLQP